VDPTGSIGLHGRVSNIPAKNLYVDGAWEGDDYVFWAQGKMREGVVFGANLLLTRKISAKLGQNKLWTTTKFANEGHGHRSTCSCTTALGFPLVTRRQRVPHQRPRHPRPRRRGRPRTSTEWRAVPRADPDQVEWVYYHDMATDAKARPWSALPAKNSGDCCALGLYIKYEQRPNSRTSASGRCPRKGPT